MEEDELLKILNKTRIKEELLEMRTLYEELTLKQEKFLNDVCLHCTDGCGKCCEHFVPDVTAFEADFLAFGIIAQGKEDYVIDLMNNYDQTTGVCPLYDFNNKHHCMVYKWRPLICRLFGASASSDKNGTPVFRNCKWNTNIHDISSSDLLKSDNLVVMSDYGNKLEEYEVGATETELINVALPKAIDKIKLMLMYEQDNDNT